MRSDVNLAAFVPEFDLFPDVNATQTLADSRAGIDRVSTVAPETP